MLPNCDDATEHPPTSAANASCVICARIADFWHTNGNLGHSKREVIGKWELVEQKKDCRTCQSLVQAFKAIKSTDERVLNTLVILWYGEQSPSELVILRDHTYLTLAPFQGNPKDWVGPPRPEIYTTIVHQAIHDCNQNHAGVCHSISDPWAKLDPATELIVIDVNQQRLVTQPGSCKYVALSYVWGNTNTAPLQTTNKRYREFRQKGAFRSLSKKALLPATIEDSIILTRQLGLEYLWVDRFCIIQDDDSHKNTQLDAMAAIYANAYFTIAACEGKDGDFGLAGIGPHRPRKDPYRYFEFDTCCRMVITTPIPNTLCFEVPYHRRGWTLQEWVLSSRLLAFQDQTVSWKCRVTDKQENGHKTSVMTHPLLPSGVMTDWPDIHGYADCVGEYSWRSLTYNEDAIRAFSSITTAMGRSMKGGIFFGLPEMIFDGALLWLPYPPSSRRKYTSGKIIEKFPSWSFLGWDGGAWTDIWCDAYNYSRNTDGLCHKDRTLANVNLQLHPIIDWYKINELTGKREMIHNTFYIEEEDTNSGVERRYDQIGSTFKFQRLAAPEQVMQADTYSPVISFRTTRLFASLSDIVTWGGSICEQCTILTSPDEVVVGKIVWRASAFSIPQGPIPTSCELIRISLVESSNRIWWENFPDPERDHQNCDGQCRDRRLREYCRLSPEWTFKFYFVLWIEWENGIAYRKALGWVSKEYWDSTETEEIDVMLG